MIPVFNGSNYLRDAVDSALAQTYRNVEVIVINDGSTDSGATDGVALSYGDRIRYIRKNNGGVSTALNRGLADMTGEWFCWLSHDDRYLPEKTATQIAFFESHPDARIVAGNFDIIDEVGSRIGGYASTIDVVRTGLELLDNWVSGCALMIHRSCFDVTGRFDETNRTTQDLDMWLRLLRSEPIYWIDQTVCQIRQHPEAGSRTDMRHSEEKDQLFAQLPVRYPITFFDPDAVTPEARAKTLFRIAVAAMRVQAWRGAAEIVERGWMEQSGPRSPLLLPRVLGVRGASRWWSAEAFLAGKWKSLVRRCRRLSGP